MLIEDNIDKIQPPLIKDKKQIRKNRLKIISTICFGAVSVVSAIYLYKKKKVPVVNPHVIPTKKDPQNKNCYAEMGVVFLATMAGTVLIMRSYKKPKPPEIIQKPLNTPLPLPYTNMPYISTSILLKQLDEDARLGQIRDSLMPFSD